MKKIILIIKREYITRVRKNSFLWMTLLGPFIFALILIVPYWFASSSQETKIVQVVDSGNKLEGQLPQSEYLAFEYSHENNVKKDEKSYAGILIIPDSDIQNSQGITLYSNPELTLSDQMYIEKLVGRQLIDLRLKQAGVDPKLLIAIQEPIRIEKKSLATESKAQNNNETLAAISIFGAVLIYFFIFLYGVQVMKGIIEEKSSRIVEVVISSVTPFQLLTGKITGIALLSLTQFFMWFLLTTGITLLIPSKYKNAVQQFSDQNIEQTLAKTHDVQQAMEMNKMVSLFESVDFTLIIFGFIFYFIFGYLLYGSLFAAVGSAVDNETDTQQFVLPLTAPLFFCFIFATTIVDHPNDTMAFWLSMIPFTSPVVMMIRLPFGVPTIELVASMVILIISFIGCAWVSARIYRVGILMYGKKVSYRELSRWLFYKSV